MNKDSIAQILPDNYHRDQHLDQYKLHIEGTRKALIDSGLYSKVNVAFAFSSNRYSFSNIYHDASGSVAGLIRQSYSNSVRSNYIEYQKLKKGSDAAVQKSLREVDELLLFDYRNLKNQASKSTALITACTLGIIPGFVKSDISIKVTIIRKNDIVHLLNKQPDKMSKSHSYTTDDKLTRLVNLFVLPLAPFMTKNSVLEKIVYNNTLTLINKINSSH